LSTLWPRDKSPKGSRTYGEYRQMLQEKDLDIVLIAPTDIVESQAMLAAARKYKRVVQVGTQRRSTPHLMEAREQTCRSIAVNSLLLPDRPLCSRLIIASGLPSRGQSHWRYSPLPSQQGQ
jgi:hypothetical protein